MRHLRNAIDFKASELLGFDLLLAVSAAVGGVLLGLRRPELVADNVGTLATLLTAIIGAVLAGVAIQAAFMDQAFLQRLAQIDREPVRYLAPFIFTAVLGVFASLALVLLGLTATTALPAWRGIITGTAGFLCVYTLASLLPALDTLVQFIGLKAEAAAVDAVPAEPRPEPGSVRRISR